MKLSGSIASRLPRALTFARPMSNSYKPDSGRFPAFEPKEIANLPPKERLTSVHDQEGEWSRKQIDDSMRENVMFTWGATDPVRINSTNIVRGEGIYLFDGAGKRYVDVSAGAVCSNLGHTVPESVKQAAIDQLNKIAFVYGDLCTTDERAKIAKILADVFPGDLNGMFLASGGAEANELVVKLARKYTGRHKIMTRHRSYHGATSSALAMTGDPRTWGSSSTTGFVKIVDPFPFTFKFHEDEAKAAEVAVNILHEQIICEGPDSIAAIVLEFITGANGWLIPHPTYIQGVRALCDKYGILLVSDEVMNGFGRTGEMFGFENFAGVLPDMCSFAKGVSGAYVPLSGVAVRQPIQDFFRTTPVGWGSTYSSHPLACAMGYATIKHIVEIDLPAHVKRMEAVLLDEFAKLEQKYKCVKATRAIGLAAGIDLAGLDGNFICDMHENALAVQHLKKVGRDKGLIFLVRGHHIHITPPLVITEEELRETMATLGECLADLDNFLEAHA